MPPLPSIPAVDGPAVLVDSDGVVDVVDGAKAGRNGSVPGLLNDSISSACTDELHASAEQQTSSSPTGTATTADIGPGPAVGMEVLGIYKRGAVPREAELPKDYVLKDCAQDQVMVRQRLRTRPLLDDAEEEHGLVEEEDETDSDSSSDSSSDGSDDSGDGSDADDESAAQTTNKKQQTQTQRQKKKKKMSKQSKKERTAKSLRRRLKSKAADGTEYDVAMFKPEQGLVMTKSDWPFYHADLSEHSDSSDDERVSSLVAYLSCLSLVHAFYVLLILLNSQKACSISIIIH